MARCLAIIRASPSTMFYNDVLCVILPGVSCCAQSALNRWHGVFPVMLHRCQAWDKGMNYSDQASKRGVEFVKTSSLALILRATMLSTDEVFDVEAVLNIVRSAQDASPPPLEFLGMGPLESIFGLSLFCIVCRLGHNPEV